MPERRSGKITKISGNMVTVEIDSRVIQNEVIYLKHGRESLKAEVIRIRGNKAEAQVYENTGGLQVGDPVEFTGNLLSVELGPGLLGQIFDGLQNPLPQLAEQYGFFLKRGAYLTALAEEKDWEFIKTLRSSINSPINRNTKENRCKKCFELHTPENCHSKKQKSYNKND